MPELQSPLDAHDWKQCIDDNRTNADVVRALRREWTDDEDSE